MPVLEGTVGVAILERIVGATLGTTYFEYKRKENHESYHENKAQRDIF